MIKASINQYENLIGRVHSEIQLVGRIRSEDVIVGRLSKPVGYEEYKGVYNITPKATSQTMDTKNKLMKKDITVEAIPYYEVENVQGGVTVIIGG